MDKRVIENFKSHQTRRAMCVALHQARTATHVPPRVPQVRELTANERDRLMHRRLDYDAAMRERATQVFGRKKKLPLPVFSCENTGDEQVRPRILCAATS